MTSVCALGAKTKWIFFGSSWQKKPFAFVQMSNSEYLLILQGWRFVWKFCGVQFSLSLAQRNEPDLQCSSGVAAGRFLSAANLWAVGAKLSAFQMDFHNNSAKNYSEAHSCAVSVQINIYVSVSVCSIVLRFLSADLLRIDWFLSDGGASVRETLVTRVNSESVCFCSKLQTWTLIVEFEKIRPVSQTFTWFQKKFHCCIWSLSGFAAWFSEQTSDWSKNKL